MPSLKLDVRMTDTGALSRDLDRRLQQFVRAEKAARQSAARTATTASKARWDARTNRRNPGGLGAFLGRETTGGRLGDLVRWRPLASGGVGLNLQELNAKAPHWIIQELGTGERAVVRVGGRSNPRGRPARGASYVRTVKSQVGRRIPGGLVWATGGRVYSPPPGSGREQLYLRSQVKGAPANARGMRIRREIQGQHFVQKGGQEGFRQYRNEVLAAARQAFRRR